MPSSNIAVEGSDILREKLLSPYMKDIKNFEVYAIADKIYPFGKVKNLQAKV